MKQLFYLSFLIMAACGVKHTNVDYGKTTAGDLIAEKGEPLEQKTVPVQDTKMFVYDGNEKFQIQNDVVTHGFKDPKGDEKSLLFWKHKFKDCETETKKISEPQGHELPEYEMKCSAQGITVIYTEGSEFVSRIVEHEKK